MPGKFEQAEGGTLLLDEITEMDLSLQAKLLRVIQERQVERLGGKKTLDLDVRILATTNRDLADYVAEGNFREDLYHRLAVILMHVPSLNERREDIPVLAEHFLTMVCAEHGISRKSFSEDALLELQKTDSVLFDSLHSFRVAFGNLFPFGRLWSILLNSGLYHCLLKFRLCTAKEGGMAVSAVWKLAHLLDPAPPLEPRSTPKHTGGDPGSESRSVSLS